MPDKCGRNVNNILETDPAVGLDGVPKVTTLKSMASPKVTKSKNESEGWLTR